MTKLISYSNVVATLALVLAATGSAVAFSLPRDSVRSSTIKDGQVKARDLADGAVGARQLEPGSVTAAALGAGAVGGDALSAGVIDSAKLASGAVGNGALGDGAVTSAKLGAASVTAAKLDLPPRWQVAAPASAACYATPLTLCPSWQNIGGDPAYSHAAYYRDPLGFGHLKGIISCASTCTLSSDIMALPDSPAQRQVFAAKFSNGNEGVARVDVIPAGFDHPGDPALVRVIAGAASDYLSLDGITFAVGA